MTHSRVSNLKKCHHKRSTLKNALDLNHGANVCGCDSGLTGLSQGAVMRMSQADVGAEANDLRGSFVEAEAAALTHTRADGQISVSQICRACWSP